jgi:hypothetical protein
MGQGMPSYMNAATCFPQLLPEGKVVFSQTDNDLCARQNPSTQREFAVDQIRTHDRNKVFVTTMCPHALPSACRCANHIVYTRLGTKTGPPGGKPDRKAPKNGQQRLAPSRHTTSCLTASFPCPNSPPTATPMRGDDTNKPFAGF